MKTILFIALLVASIAMASLVTATDHCNVFTTCQTCIGEGDSLCGWCSTVDSEGFQCSGVNKQGRNNFTCNGIFNTNQCSRGYVCNNQTFTCDLTNAGAGISQAECTAECSPVGKLFKCDNTTYQCVVVPTTTPGGQAQSICEASCKNPLSTTNPTESQATATHSPASMSPHSQSPQSSQAPVSSTTAAPLFKCDPATVSCVPAQTGEAGSSSLSVCQAQCHHQNNTPSTLIGLWRGFPISAEFSPSEYDYNFDAQGNVQYTHAPGVVLSGTATFVETSFVVTFTDGSQQACLFSNQNTQPTTYEMIFACAEGATPPSSVSVAMAGGNGAFVLLASRCVDATICQFSLSAGPTSSHNSIKKKHSLLRSLQQQPAINDQCTAFGANCSYCLAQVDCGWCSQNVQYNVSGSTVTGTQCAGFSANGHTPWKCDGTYVSGTCPIGYQCDAQTEQCYLAPNGDGIPSLAQCDAGCKSKKGPPSQLVGNYRGIQINEQYQPGVWRINMNSTHFTTTFPDGKSVTGAVSHYAQYLFFTVDGQQTACIWSSNTASGGIVEYVTYACNIYGEALPQGFDLSMNPTNGTEVLAAKCLGSDCKW